MHACVSVCVCVSVCAYMQPSVSVDDDMTNKIKQHS